MNSNKTIFLKEVLKQMRTPNADGKAVPFALAVRTFQANSKTGGKMNRYPHAKLVMQEKHTANNSIKNLRYAPRKVVERKNPHHFKNETRNIKLPNGQVKKIYIKNIIEFNGAKVNY